MTRLPCVADGCAPYCCSCSSFNSTPVAKAYNTSLLRPLCRWHAPQALDKRRGVKIDCLSSLERREYRAGRKLPNTASPPAPAMVAQQYDTT